MEFITACFFDGFFNVQKNNETKNKGKMDKINLIDPVFLSSQFIVNKLGQWRDYCFYNLSIVLLFC